MEEMVFGTQRISNTNQEMKILNLYRYLIVSCKDFDCWLPGDCVTRRVQRSANVEQLLRKSRKN